MARIPFTPEQRKANRRALDQRRYALHRSQFLAQSNARYHARRATMTPEELTEFKARHCTSTAKRHALKMAAPRSDLTHQQWLDIQAAQEHRCAYCGKRCKGKLTQDHIQPLSKGGNHTLHNVIGACRTCNSRKGNRAILSPVQPLLL